MDNQAEKESLGLEVEANAVNAEEEEGISEEDNSFLGRLSTYFPDYYSWW